MPDLSGTAVMLTAWRRPHYLRPVLESWAAADGIGDVECLMIALGRTDRYEQQLDLIEEMRPKFGCPLVVAEQSERAHAAPGPPTAIAEAITALFADPAIDFVVAGEEDVAVSSDVLAYMAWARGKFAGDPSVLIACAHNQSGSGWDDPAADDTAADQRDVRLVPYFSPWVWGTWRDRWQQVLEPAWDWDVTSGGPVTSGYDWNIQLRIIPSGPFTCVVPDAARSQNIGQFGGIYAHPSKFAGTQARSFRRRRDPGYELVTS